MAAGLQGGIGTFFAAFANRHPAWRLRLLRLYSRPRLKVRGSQMSRSKQVIMLLAAAAAVGVVLYWAWSRQPARPPAMEAVPGLAWIPAESGLVAGVNLAAVREQPWLVAELRAVAGAQAEAADYRAFVE